jgi:hypothetical protein
MGTIAKHRTPLAKSRQRLQAGPPDFLFDTDRESLGRLRPGSGRADRVSEAKSDGVWALRLLRALWLALHHSPPRASHAREDGHLPHLA